MNSSASRGCEMVFYDNQPLGSIWERLDSPGAEARGIEPDDLTIV